MKARHVILVFGISSVGKTTACRDYVSRHPDFIQISASKLLSDAKARGRLQLRSESPEVILENQSTLVAEFGKFTAQVPGRSILMDAHAVIHNGASIIYIPTAIIGDLQPTGLILLNAKPEEVQRRRSIREGIPLPSIDRIASELSEEEQTVKRYADELELPLIIGNVSEYISLDNLIEMLLKI